MSRGGARYRSGPAANPNSLRQDPGDWRRLPAAGREGDAPEWPLSKANVRERALWEAHWHRPQAIVWEEHGLAYEVAFYIRALAKAESREATAADRSIAVRLQVELGLSEAGLRANKWTIDGEPATQENVLRATGTEASSAKERLRKLQVVK